MDTFYAALPYVLIFGQGLGPSIIAGGFAKSGSVKSRWVVASLAALPIPALVAGFAMVAFAHSFVGTSPECAADCGADRAAFRTLVTAALGFYVMGFCTALWGYRSGRALYESRRSR